MSSLREICAQMSLLNDRRFVEVPEVVERSEAERDRDRVLYSTAFRRLDGVTQVAAASEISLFHNRLTHSLKVGQVGRKIAATLNQLARVQPAGVVRDACYRYSGVPYDEVREIAFDPWILETAGMVHDLGHPPFGHIAEKALQKAVSATPNERERLRVPEGFVLNDSFEGNAQSFRIVTKLAFGRMFADDALGQEAGLNLTRASLSAMQKYPWRRNNLPSGIDGKKEKWGAYEPERDLLEWVTQGLPGREDNRIRPDGLPEFRSIAAQAMDWADDITYAVHDVEDFCRAGLIPADLLREYRSGNPLIEGFFNYCLPKLMNNRLLRVKLPDSDREAVLKVREIFDETLRTLPDFSQSTRRAREKFRLWSSQHIEIYTGPGLDNGIKLAPDIGFIDVSVNTLAQVEILKKLTWYFVIERVSFGSAQRGQAKIVRDLFVWICDWSMDSYHPQFESAAVPRTNYHLDGLPNRLIDILDVTFWDSNAGNGYRTSKENVARAVCDYISSLTEKQAVELHSRLNGATHVAMLDNSFQY